MEGINNNYSKTPFYQISNYLDYLCAVFEFFLIIFLLIQYFKSRQRFNSGFYLILTVGYIADFTFSCFWLLYDIFDNQYKWIQYSAFIMEWYTLLFLGIWNCILGMNLCTAVGFPFKHSKIWSGKLLYCIVFSLLMFPFLVNGYNLPSLYCRVHLHEPQCQSYKVSYFLISAILGAIFNLLALVFVSFGISRASLLANNSCHSKTEKRLMIQTIITSFLQILMYAFYAYSSVFTIFDPSYLTFTSIGMIVFLLQHYSNITILFIVNPNVRKRFFSFYGINLSFLNGHRIKPSQSQFVSSKF